MASPPPGRELLATSTLFAAPPSLCPHLRRSQFRMPTNTLTFAERLMAFSTALATIARMQKTVNPKQRPRLCIICLALWNRRN